MWMQVVLATLRIAAAATLGVMAHHVTRSAGFGDSTAIIVAAVFGGNLGPPLVDEFIKLVRSKL